MLGAERVPVFLQVNKNASEVTDVDLAWSGQAQEFNLYRSESPIDLIAPKNILLTTPLCSATDTRAGAFEILFYKVDRASE